MTNPNYWYIHTTLGGGSYHRSEKAGRKAFTSCVQSHAKAKNICTITLAHGNTIVETTTLGEAR